MFCKMKKKMLITTGSLLALAAVTTTLVAVNTNSNEEMSRLMKKNVEALAGGENPMDSHVWSVYAESSVNWTCTPDGVSACPSPF